MKAEIKITLKEELLEELMESCRITTDKEMEGLLKATFFSSVGKDMDKIGSVEITVTSEDTKAEDTSEPQYATSDFFTAATTLFGKASYDPVECRTTIKCPTCGHVHGFLGRFLVNGSMACEHCGRQFQFGYSEV